MVKIKTKIDKKLKQQIIDDYIQEQKEIWIDRMLQGALLCIFMGLASIYGHFLNLTPSSWPEIFVPLFVLLSWLAAKLR